MERCDPFEAAARWWYPIRRSPAVPAAGQAARPPRFAHLHPFPVKLQGREVFVFRRAEGCPGPTCRVIPGSARRPDRRRAFKHGHPAEMEAGPVGLRATAPGFCWALSGSDSLVVAGIVCEYGGSGFRAVALQKQGFHRRRRVALRWQSDPPGRRFGRPPRRPPRPTAVDFRLRSLQDLACLEAVGRSWPRPASRPSPKGIEQRSSTAPPLARRASKRALRTRGCR